jgi:hypothetical protein
MKTHDDPQTLHAQLYKPGPLHDERKELVAKLMEIPLQTGDILYRHSDAKGPFGLPFSKLVCLLTKSKFSHGSVVIILEGEPFVMEINDQGTLLMRIVDWLDTVATKNFRVYRLKESTPELVLAIDTVVKDFLNKDPDYDFTFSDESKFYCTESVVWVYKSVGVQLIQPETIKQVVPGWIYPIFKVVNWFMKKFSSASMSMDTPMYYVGNETRGLMSSPLTKLIYDHQAK